MNDELGFLVSHKFPEPELAQRWRDCLVDVECPAHHDAPEFFLEPFWETKRPVAVLARQEGSIHGVLTGQHNGDEVVPGLSSRPQIFLRAGASNQWAVDCLATGLLKEAGASAVVTIYSWSPAHWKVSPDTAFVPACCRGVLCWSPMRRFTLAVQRDPAPVPVQHCSLNDGHIENTK